MLRSKIRVAALGVGLLLYSPSATFAADCQVIAATHGGHWKGEALTTSRALAARYADELKQKMGWRSVAVTATKVKPDPFWKIARPTGVPDGVVVGSFVTSRAYSTCFTGVVVPYVCTSGSKICGK